jgi:hypothetical protein
LLANVLLKYISAATNTHKRAEAFLGEGVLFGPPLNFISRSKPDPGGRHLVFKAAAFEHRTWKSIHIIKGRYQATITSRHSNLERYR